MTAYSAKEFNTSQVPTALTFIADSVGKERGKLNVITTAAGATATHGTLDIGYDVIVFITGAASTATLPVGVDGQELKMVMDTDGGDMVVTCASLNGGNTITFDGADSIHLVYDETEAAWLTIGTATAALSTV